MNFSSLFLGSIQNKCFVCKIPPEEQQRCQHNVQKHAGGWSVSDPWANLKFRLGAGLHITKPSTTKTWNQSPLATFSTKTQLWTERLESRTRRRRIRARVQHMSDKVLTKSSRREKVARRKMHSAGNRTYNKRMDPNPNEGMFTASSLTGEEARCRAFQSKLPAQT